MAQPKRRSSPARRNKRRANRALTAPNVIKCPNCAMSIMPHTVCPECGFYKGRQVVVKSEG